MIRFFKALAEAIRNQGRPDKNRATRRQRDRMKGRMNPDGRFFGGVQYSAAVKDGKVDRKMAGK